VQPRKSNRVSQAPLLRLRQLGVISGCGALLIAGPLCVVWKQAYITQMSIRRSSVADSLGLLTKQAAQLRLSVDRLSAADRIETIARQRLGLEYPPASSIVIVKQHLKKTRPAAGGGFFALWRRSVNGGRG